MDSQSSEIRCQVSPRVPDPPYAVDFCCVDLMAVIEIDGEGHYTQEGIKRDRERDQFLNRYGYCFLRIPG